MRLQPRMIGKVWGRDNLPVMFDPPAERVGEIWFEPPPNVRLRLLIKHLFTSQKLSVQVHPNDGQAMRRGLSGGKEECWYVMAAEPDATIGLGLVEAVSPDALRSAAITGKIENLLDWKPVKAGDFFYVPAGTVHAIGAGLSLIEVQQNADVTYRLYDYGRPRELHLDDAVAVARGEAYDMLNHRHVTGSVSVVLVDGPALRLFRIAGSNRDLIDAVKAKEWHIVPLNGYVSVDSERIDAGQSAICEYPGQIDLTGNRECLIATTMD